MKNIRKIQTKSEMDKKNKKNQIIIGILLVGLMILSSVGYAFVHEDNGIGSTTKSSYNGFSFLKNGEFWGVSISGSTFNFKNLPQDTVNASVSLGSINLNSYSAKPLYLIGSDKSYEAAREIVNNLGTSVLRYQDACLNGTICENPDFPTKECNENLIIFSDVQTSSNVNQTRVYTDGSCVYISGDYALGADAFLYKLLGVK